MRNIAPIRILPVLLAAVACAQPPQHESPRQAAAAIMAELQPGAPLEHLLGMMEEHLDRAAEGRLEGETVLDFRRAEAISDRLLESRLPFEWISNQQYSLEARLRQIQSMADRVLAMLDTGAPRDSTLAELNLLRQQVQQVQQTIAQGGTQAPPPIHRLLQGGDTAGTAARREFQQQQQQQQPTGPAPLGTPAAGGGA